MYFDDNFPWSTFFVSIIKIEDFIFRPKTFHAHKMNTEENKTTKYLQRINISIVSLCDDTSHSKRIHRTT